MAQAVRRLGGEVALVDMAERVLANEPAPLGEALGEVLRRDGVELVLGVQAAGARRDGDEYVLELRRRPASSAGTACSSRRVVARESTASGSRPSASPPTPHGIPVDAQLRAGDGLWAIGDVTGIWPLTTTGKYQGDIVAANILGEPREANYDALPRVVFTDPQAASVGRADARFTATAPVSGVARTATYTRAVRRVERLPDPAQRRRAADRRVRARARGRRVAPAGHPGDPRSVPLDVLRDTIQPFPTFSEIYADALKALRAEIAAGGG